MQWISQHKLIFGIVVIAVVAAVWYGMSSSSAPAPLLTTDTVSTSAGSPTAESSDQQLVGTLLTLRAVTLSGTIFSDPAFVSLQDFGTPIIPEPVGRQNPFAPSSSAQNTPSATTTKNTQLFTPKK